MQPQLAGATRVWSKMRRAFLLVLVLGCEMDAPRSRVKAPPPEPTETLPDEFPEIQLLDVKVRDYGTDAPIAGATIDLVRYGDCPTEACPPTNRLSAVTDDSGMKRFEVEGSRWTVERITAPDGYVTGCPADEDARHDLFVAGNDPRNVLSNAQVIPPARTVFTCRPVSWSALAVRDTRAATKLAKAVPEIRTWLRSHRDARVTQIELTSLRWRVQLQTPGDDSETWIVEVDALDQSAETVAHWGGTEPLEMSPD